MFAASSAAGATLQPVARILLLICSVQIMVTNCENADFDGPFVGKYFTDERCPWITIFYGQSVDECLDLCLSHRGPQACTAVNYRERDNYCALLFCPLPVLPPAGNSPDYNAYSLKPEAYFDGPFLNQYYSNEQCPVIEDDHFIVVAECLDLCLSIRHPQACTAVNYYYLDNTCYLRACKMPVPKPARFDKDVESYSLKPGTTNQTISATPSPKDPLEHLKKSGCKAVKGTCQRKTDICEGKLKVGGKWCKKSKKYGCCNPPKENERCLRGFERIGDNCYWFSSDRGDQRTWSDARQKCKDIGRVYQKNVHLAELGAPNNCGSDGLLMEIIAKKGGQPWLGAHSPTKSNTGWIWAYSQRTLSLSFPYWGPIQPSGDGWCMDAWVPKAPWYPKAPYHRVYLNDVNCEHKLDYVCQFFP